MEILPSSLRMEDALLVIEWNDGTEQRLSVSTLRERCPCSVCRKQEPKTQESKPGNSLNILAPEEARPLEITSMTPVGNYAYSIDFSDGHRTGIYSFEFLRNLK